ncbi:LysE family translocator [Maridesulfovibrio zosterae]|uniref:LysE family translocator n=1 Tax=Maridesulfovibrio zosterae TaxID=82171 RepID=UPI0003FEC42F|nr:LysE family translocator [Maridesulfovibrio zosterae]
MTLSTTVALILAVLIFAAIPGPGVMSILAQSVARGFKFTALWCLGIVMGDLVYLLMAIFGMEFAAKQIGPGFIVLKLVGAAYLLYLGLKCWLAPAPSTDQPKLPQKKGVFNTVIAGLCLSLGNPKLIVFYCGFLPGFVNLQELTGTESIMIICAIIPTVLSVLLGYAWVGAKGRKIIRSPKIWKTANRCAGSVLIGSSIAVVTE